MRKQEYLLFTSIFFFARSVKCIQTPSDINFRKGRVTVHYWTNFRAIQVTVLIHCDGWTATQLVMTGRVPEFGFSSTRDQPKNGFMASSTRLFFIFRQTSGIFDDFSKFHNTFGTHTHSTALKASNMPKSGKKWIKVLFKLP